MKHHFRGYIAGLSILLGENEKSEVLSCLHKCKETLEVPSVKLLEPGMELITNSGSFSLFPFFLFDCVIENIDTNWKKKINLI